jgi:hypothetical protein
VEAEVSAQGRESGMKTLIFVVYIAIGIVVAAMNDYLGGVGSLSEIINLVLAILLWPAVLLGVDFNVDVGGGNDKNEGGKDNGGDKKDGKKNGALVLIGPALVYSRAFVEKRISVAKDSRRSA